MRIALDFDGTYTADPDFWQMFVRTLLDRHHEVYIVTSRDEHNDGINWKSIKQEGPPCPVIFCDGRPKHMVTEAAGVHIDVWIDDNPRSIFGGTALGSHDELKSWREQDIHRGTDLTPHGSSRGHAFAGQDDYRGRL